jgi:hypothetical protein
VANGVGDNMSDQERAIHDLKEAVEKRRATLVRATILDQDNQRIATRTATLNPKALRGRFG